MRAKRQNESAIKSQIVEYAESGGRSSTGMTYPEVVGILGEAGEEMSRNELAGITTVMYSWKRFGGANMNAMFQNGKLISKAQFGL